MDVYNKVFGDQFAELIGRSLLEYFNSKQFPMRLLRDPKLNLLYLKAQIHMIDNDGSLSEVERCGLITGALDTYYENGGKPLTIRKFSPSGVEK